MTPTTIWISPAGTVTVTRGGKEIAAFEASTPQLDLLARQAVEALAMRALHGRHDMTGAAK